MKREEGVSGGKCGSRGRSPRGLETCTVTVMRVRGLTGNCEYQGTESRWKSGQRVGVWEEEGSTTGLRSCALGWLSEVGGETRRLPS